MRRPVASHVDSTPARVWLIGNGSLLNDEAAKLIAEKGAVFVPSIQVLAQLKPIYTDPIRKAKLQEAFDGTYLGFDQKLQRKVAVKAISSQFRLNEVAKARFLREARILSQLKHPSVCVVHDFIERDDADLLVLELVEGRNLRATLERGITVQQKMSVACRTSRSITCDAPRVDTSPAQGAREVTPVTSSLASACHCFQL